MDCDCGAEGIAEARVLWTLLLVNATMFVVECVAGWLAGSTGLLADSLDMFADAAVYGLALRAVGRARGHQVRAAFASGIAQLALGLGVLAEVVRRAFAGHEPQPAVMAVVGALALAANVACLTLLWRHRHGAVHMRASWIFSANDVLANAGVLLAGALVAWTGSALPDLAIGGIIAVLVTRGGVRILAEARRERSAA